MINKYPQIHIIFDRRKKATLKKASSLEIRVSYDYRQKYISTGIMLLSNQWKDGNIINTPDALYISNTLSSLLSDIRKILTEMMEKGNVDLDAIPEQLKSLHSPKITFIEYCKQRAVIRKYGKRKDTQERYDRFIRLFSAWGGITLFSEINEKNIMSYDQYLKNRGLKPYSKWNNYHRFLNSFIIDAIKDGHLNKNPYQWVNIEINKNSNTLERSLTPTEFYKIKTKPLPTDTLNKMRDVFVFQIYTCLSYSDLRDFDVNAIQEINGSKVYVGKRQKTGKGFTIPLLPPALEILDKYKGKLPVVNNATYNLYLKALAQSVGIDKPISSHWARHTGATLLLNEGIPMQIVSKICGHSSTRITEQIYAKLLDETVVDAVANLKL